MLQAIGSSQTQLIFIPPCIFSNFIVQRGIIIPGMAEPPIDGAPMPIRSIMGFIIMGFIIIGFIIVLFILVILIRSVLLGRGDTGYANQFPGRWLPLLEWPLLTPLLRFS
jgi:hypothetical protein